MNIEQYIPTDSWVRNYKAMKNPKLLGCLADFRAVVDLGYSPAAFSHECAVNRVIEHGGDIYENYERCKDEARSRGLTVV